VGLVPGDPMGRDRTGSESLEKNDRYSGYEMGYRYQCLWKVRSDSIGFLSETDLGGDILFLILK
jgi:hypothetical protein